MKDNSLEPSNSSITRVTGHDGSHINEFPREKGYMVHGIKRKVSILNTEKTNYIYEDSQILDSRFTLHYLDHEDY